MEILSEGQVFGGLAFVHGRLANQLEVVLICNPPAAVAACHLHYRVGSAQEGEQEQGLAHFFEHMMFRETEQLADGAFDRLAAEMGGVGLNAYTSYDATAYHISVPCAQLERLLELEAQRMVHLKLSPAQVEAERGAVLGELRMLADQPSEQLWNGLMRAAYRQHPYRRPIIGCLEQVQGFRTEDFARFYARHYAPPRAVLTLVGGFSLPETAALVARVFAPIPARGQAAAAAGEAGTEAAPPLPAAEPPWESSQRCVLQHPRITAATLITAWQAPPLPSADTAALLLLFAHLNAGNASVLQQRLVQEGPCTQASLVHLGLELPLRQAGLLLFEAEVGHGHTAQAAEQALREVLEQARRGPWHRQALQRAYHQLRLGQVSLRQSNAGLAQQVCSNAATLGDPWFTENVLERVQATPPEAAGEVLERLLLDAPQLAVVQEPAPAGPPGGQA